MMTSKQSGDQISEGLSPTLHLSGPYFAAYD